MWIHKLPDFVINRLKAWEIVQRPASLLKELVENSLDAWATKIEVNINDGGKSFLSVQDNGSGIELSDMDLLLERYATSKISSEKDLYSLESYGFRWEALASIAEVSKITVLTKTQYAEIGTKLVRRGNVNVVRHMGVPFEHWTLITVEDLFYNVPARLKFLKSAQTEFYYCYNYFLDVSLYHYDKAFILKKNDKIVFDLKPASELHTRILDLYKKDWGEKLISFSQSEEWITMRWILSDSSLRFWSAENIKIYVNGRPVQDRVIRRALLDAYSRQIAPWEYPMAILMVEVDPASVDVNVHPWKLEVKFSDSQKVYQFVHDSVQDTLWKHKIGAAGAEFFRSQDKLTGIQSPSRIEKGEPSHFNSAQSVNSNTNWKLDFSNMLDGISIGNSTTSEPQRKVQQSMLWFEKPWMQVSQFWSFDQEEVKSQYLFHPDLWEYQILGQARNSYIVLQSDTALYRVDQHALAERIAFEKMKLSQDHAPENLLQPLKFEITQIPNLAEKIEELNTLGFEISMLSESVVVIYAIPKVFVQYPIDMQTLLNHVLYLEKITFEHLLDGIYATKACKASIKAWHKLSYLQMQQLIQDGFEHIPWMFVCQHWRPFFIKMEKWDVDKLFDR